MTNQMTCRSLLVGWSPTLESRQACDDFDIQHGYVSLTPSGSKFGWHQGHIFGLKFWIIAVRLSSETWFLTVDNYTSGPLLLKIFRSNDIYFLRLEQIVEV